MMTIERDSTRADTARTDTGRTTRRTNVAASIETERQA